MSLLRRGGLSSIDLMLKEVTDMSDYETFSLVILIIGLVISAITLGITRSEHRISNGSLTTCIVTFQSFMSQSLFF